MRFELVLRFDYGSIMPWVRRRPDGISAIAGPSAMVLRTPLPIEGRDKRTVAEFVVHTGETKYLKERRCRSELRKLAF